MNYMDLPLHTLRYLADRGSHLAALEISRRHVVALKLTRSL